MNIFSVLSRGLEGPFDDVKGLPSKTWLKCSEVRLISRSLCGNMAGLVNEIINCLSSVHWGTIADVCVGMPVQVVTFSIKW